MGQGNQPSLFVFMGLPASGKTALARAWSRKHHYSYFNFDVVCQQLASGREELYSLAMNRRTYDALLTYAEQELAAGRSVVLDAFYGSCSERARLTELAEKTGVTPHFVLCYCSEKATKGRLAERTSGGQAGSERGWQNFKVQQENVDPLDDLEPTMVVSINTESPHEQLMDQLDFVFEKKPPITVVSQ